MKKIPALFLIILSIVFCEIIFATQTVNAAQTEKKVIVIDAGHQKKGDNTLEPIGPGAKTKKKKVSYGTEGRYSKVPEYELTLTLAKKLKKELESRGYKVIMTRTKNDVNISNSERAKIANDAKADAFIRIHANGLDNNSVYGANTICITSKNPYNKQIYGKSRKLSDDVIKEFAASTGCKNRGVSEIDTMSGLNWSEVPVTIIEVGYMTNKSEDLKLQTSAYQKKMVTGLANGIDRYFNTSVKSVAITSPVEVSSLKTGVYTVKQSKDKSTSFTITTKVKVKGDISKKVYFTSSNSKLVKVDKNSGKVTTVKNKYGTAVITVRAMGDRDVFAKLKVTVKKK